MSARWGVTCPAVPPPVNTAAQAGSVIVTVKLNVRKQPNTRADIVQVLSPGTALNFVARVDNGQAINNNPVWYKDTNDNYFWSGGVKQNQ